MSLHRAIGFSLSLIHIVLLFIVHASHGWMMTDSQVDEYHAGLWTICSEKFGCKPLRPHDVHLDLIRCFMVLATLASVSAMLWTVEWDHVIHCNYCFPPKSLITSIFNFLAGIFVLVAVVVFHIKVNQLSTAVPPAKKWAFYLSCAICILCFLTVSLNITRIFMILALIMSFVALALSMPWEWIVRCSSPFLSRPLLISIFSFIAAICSLIAVVVFGVQVDRKSDSAHPSGKIAFYLSCFTSAFSFLAAVYNGLVHKFSLWEVASSGRVEDTQKPDETA
uniref:uncharacterized protein LOC114603496 n=1 Tax=Podarcis muralis TaxID=64176 RepID=UPI00109F989A|nr:uncharacterized protein LOC114603496 [Podarcis muralis]